MEETVHAKNSLRVCTENFRGVVKLIRKNGFENDNWRSLRDKLLKKFFDLLFAEYDYAQTIDGEILLWKYLFHGPIDLYRASFRKRSFREALSLEFGNFLMGSIEFYQLLAKTLKEKYKLRIDRPFLDRGDLYRYHRDLPRSDKRRELWTQASRYYREALVLWPENGLSHNQLAVLYSYKKDVYNQLYCYYRALSVRVPFAGAKSNLFALFESNENEYNSVQWENLRIVDEGNSIETNLKGRQEDHRDNARNNRGTGEILTSSSSRTRPQLFGSMLVRLHGLYFSKRNNVKLLNQLSTNILSNIQEQLDNSLLSPKKDFEEGMWVKLTIISMSCIFFLDRKGFFGDGVHEQSAKSAILFLQKLCFILLRVFHRDGSRSKLSQGQKLVLKPLSLICSYFSIHSDHIRFHENNWVTFVRKVSDLSCFLWPCTTTSNVKGDNHEDIRFRDYFFQILSAVCNSVLHSMLLINGDSLSSKQGKNVYGRVKSPNDLLKVWGLDQSKLVAPVSEELELQSFLPLLDSFSFSAANHFTVGFHLSPLGGVVALRRRLAKVINLCVILTTQKEKYNCLSFDSEKISFQSSFPHLESRIVSVSVVKKANVSVSSDISVEESVKDDDLDDELGDVILFQPHALSRSPLHTREKDQVTINEIPTASTLDTTATSDITATGITSNTTPNPTHQIPIVEKDAEAPPSLYDMIVFEERRIQSSSFVKSKSAGASGKEQKKGRKHHGIEVVYNLGKQQKPVRSAASEKAKSSRVRDTTTQVANTSNISSTGSLPGAYSSTLHTPTPNENISFSPSTISNTSSVSNSTPTKDQTLTQHAKSTLSSSDSTELISSPLFSLSPTSLPEAPDNKKPQSSVTTTAAISSESSTLSTTTEDSPPFSPPEGIAVDSPQYKILQDIYLQKEKENQQQQRREQDMLFQIQQQQEQLRQLLLEKEERESQSFPAQMMVQQQFGLFKQQLQGGRDTRNPSHLQYPAVSETFQPQQNNQERLYSQYFSTQPLHVNYPTHIPSSSGDLTGNFDSLHDEADLDWNSIYSDLSHWKDTASNSMLGEENPINQYLPLPGVNSQFSLSPIPFLTAHDDVDSPSNFKTYQTFSSAHEPSNFTESSSSYFFGDNSEFFSHQGPPPGLTTPHAMSTNAILSNTTPLTPPPGIN